MDQVVIEDCKPSGPLCTSTYTSILLIDYLLYKLEKNNTSP